MGVRGAESGIFENQDVVVANQIEAPSGKASIILSTVPTFDLAARLFAEPAASAPDHMHAFLASGGELERAIAVEIDGQHLASDA